jgi:hypothetical protein
MREVVPQRAHQDALRAPAEGVGEAQVSSRRSSRPESASPCDRATDGAIPEGASCFVR